MKRNYTITKVLFLFFIFSLFSAADELNLDGNRYLAYVKMDYDGNLDPDGTFEVPMYLRLYHNVQGKTVCGQVIACAFIHEGGVLEGFELDSLYIAKSKVKGTKRMVFDLVKGDETIMKKIKTRILNNGDELIATLKGDNGKMKIYFYRLEEKTGGIFLGDKKKMAVPAGKVKTIAGSVIGFYKKAKSSTSLANSNDQSWLWINNMPWEKFWRTFHTGLNQKAGTNIYSFQTLSGDGTVTVNYNEHERNSSISLTYNTQNDTYTGDYHLFSLTPKSKDPKFKIYSAKFSHGFNDDQLTIDLEIIKNLEEEFKILVTNQDGDEVEITDYTRDEQNGTIEIVLLGEFYSDGDTITVQLINIKGGGSAEESAEVDNIHTS